MIDGKILIDTFEANAYYNGRLKYADNFIDRLLAEIYLMMSETILQGDK